MSDDKKPGDELEAPAESGSDDTEARDSVDDSASEPSAIERAAEQDVLRLGEEDGESHEVNDAPEDPATEDAVHPPDDTTTLSGTDADSDTHTDGGAPDTGSEDDSAAADSTPEAGAAESPTSETDADQPETAAVSLKEAALAAAAASSASTSPTTQPTPSHATPPPTPPASGAPPQTEPATQRGNATPIAWLALVLVLIVALGGFYLMMDIQRREGLLLQRVQGLESVSGQDTTTFDQMRDNLQRAIDLETEAMQARQQRAEEDLQRAIAEQQRVSSQQESAISRIQSQVNETVNESRDELVQRVAALQEAMQAQDQALRQQQQRISDLSVEDRESWSLAETQYLLRLANQRLLLTGDTASAEALLLSADNILRGLEDADLFDLRGALAEDLAAVRAVPKLDIQGLYLRLDALIRQTDALVMFELPERASGETPEIDAEDWKARLAAGYEVALAKLSEYIVVSRRDVPVEALMDPQYEGLVRQNMRMLLEQAQVAMISGNELLFRQSLERAQGWVSQFFKSDEQAAVAMSEELRRISDERVAVELPDLTRSLQALEDVVQARLARNGS